MSERQLEAWLLIQDDDDLAKYTADYDMRSWVVKTLQNDDKKEIVVRLVSEEESAQLNLQFREKHGPTNVLSFPAQTSVHVDAGKVTPSSEFSSFVESDPEVLSGDDLAILGDIAICVSIVEQEAREQNKSLESHWAHMVIHSVLHLQGFDHIHAEDAEEMEMLEIKLMAELGFNNPYIFA